MNSLLTVPFPTSLSLFPGIREPARHPVPGDVREERHQRGAGIHDDGGGDQEPRRTPLERSGSAQRRQDRQEPQRRGQGRLLLNSWLCPSRRRRRRRQ